MSKNQHNDDNSKRTYEKPRLRVIELAAEEVLAGGCKLNFGFGAHGSPVSCIAAGCAGIGS
jgi:hypothetical protein